MVDRGPDVEADLVILSHQGSWDYRYQVSALAATTVATGQSVALCLFFSALEHWVQGRWDALDPAPPLTVESLQDLAFPPLSGLLSPAREGGLLRVFACSASLQLLGLATDLAHSKVDAVLGWQSFSQLIRASHRCVTF